MHGFEYGLAARYGVIPSLFFLGHSSDGVTDYNPCAIISHTLNLEI